MKHIPTILIVDDFEENLIFLETILANTKANLIRALSGSEAMEKTHGIELALAIIDVRMAGMNGYELALKINEQRSGEKVSIIFLTANDLDKKQIFKGYGVGAVDYIMKPVDKNILLCKINVFLELFSKKQTIIREATLLKKSADELRNANIALRKNEEKFRNYIDHAPDGVFVADETGRYIEVNEAASKITGYSKDELLNMSILDILSERLLEDGLVQFRKELETGTSKGEFLFKHKNGTSLVWSVEAVKLSETRFLYFAKDITKLIKTRQNVLIQIKELQAFFNLAEITKKKGITIDKLFQELTNILPKSLQYPEIACIRLMVNDREFLTENFNESKWKLSASIKVNKLVVGKIMVCYLEQRPREYEGPFLKEERNLIDAIADQVGYIIQKYKVEHELKVSEDKYKTILAASPDGILLIDMKGIITEVSDIAIELLGGNSKDDLLGKNFSQFLISIKEKTLTEIIEQTINDGVVQAIELQIRKKNKSTFTGEISITVIQDSDRVPVCFMVILRDISYRKKIETKQIHADRMAIIGEMAAGIAHEINQPLNIMSLVLDRILLESRKPETMDSDFFENKSQIIFENITRMRNIIDHVRAFSRSHNDYVLTAFNINSSIKNAVSMIAEQFKHLGINLKLQLDNKIPQMLGNTYQFEQVIVNLLINAKDAVIEKKRIQKEFVEMIIVIRSYREKQSIIIEVTDNGIGIAEEDIDNIMLPFYTTKDEGKGTGLGLSICYQIIKEMGGNMEITSDRIYGTKIKIVLKIQKNN